MATTRRPRASPQPVGAAEGGDFWQLAKSFQRGMLALNRSPATIRINTISVRQFGAFLQARGMLMTMASITHEHVEEFVSEILRRNEASTAEIRYGGPRAFFKWAVEDGRAIARCFVKWVSSSEVQRRRGALEVCHGDVAVDEHQRALCDAQRPARRAREGASAGRHPDDHVVRGELRGRRLGGGRDVRAREGVVAADVPSAAERHPVA